MTIKNMKQKPEILKSREKVKKMKKMKLLVSEPIAEDKIEPMEENIDDWEAGIDADVNSDVDSDGVVEEKAEEELKPFFQIQVTNKRKFDEDEPTKVGKRSKLSEAALTKPPTAKEMTRLRETENLFHSNLFRLQVTEMLKETKLKPSNDILLKKWLEELKTLLLTFKPSKKYVLTKTKWLKALGIELPIEKHAEDIFKSATKCQVMKPTEVKVIGSYASGCALGPNIKVDVKVEMPKESFFHSDEMSHKYHTKRALYLAYIAHVINTSTLSEEINFKTKDSVLNPILEVKPSGKLGKSVLVDVHVVPQADSFKLIRFSPSKKKVSSAWYFSTESGISVENSSTPHYNASVVRDLTVDANEDYRTSLISSNPNVRDGILLLKVWLRQRNMDEGFGCFSGFIMSMYTIYLLQSRKLNTMMSSYQIARNVWNHLAQSDWCANGISLCQTATEHSSPLHEYHEHYEVVFVDATGSLNLCANMTAETYGRVRRESRLAVACLDAANINSFQALFLTKKPLNLECDHVVRLPESTLTKLVTEHGRPDQLMDYAGQVNPVALALVLSVLRRGLEKRAAQVNVALPLPFRWPIGSPPPEATRPLALGLLLDPVHAFEILEKGPQADQPESASFREYWGEQSQLRRFQDGSIVEVAVWSKPDAAANERRLIARKVVSYLLETKLGVATSEVVYLADQFESVLKRRQLVPAAFLYGTGENASRAAINSFDALAKQLRKLVNFPLDISAVHGSSAVLRYTDAFPPIATNHASSMLGAGVLVGAKDVSARLGQNISAAPEYIAPIEGTIQLSETTNWPEDLDALHRIHAAFYVEMCKQLTRQHGLVTQVHTAFFDVLKDGFVFRLRIANQKEVALMKKLVSALGVEKYRDNEASEATEKVIEHLPRLTGALHGLHLRFSAFGPGCCLAKRWLRSQLLDETHFPEVAIELLMASVFLWPEPFEPANQPQTAFFRFLGLLAATNWSTECIVLDLNEKMTKEEVLSIERTFNSERASLPALFIATSFDPTGGVWTKTAPTMQILIRVAHLATAAIRVLEDSFFTVLTPRVNVTPLFVTSTDEYDVVITLKREMSARSREVVPLTKISSKKRMPVAAYIKNKNEKMPIIGFNPVQCYIDQLRENYGEFALFFHDPHGGLVIGVLWRPSVLGLKDFKVTQVNGRKLVDGAKLAVNQEAIVEDFYVTGEGLVENVAVKADLK